ncbi:MAG: hypothetical protein CL442_09110 [Acidimicrobiaceae bacterium]|nr:hypothetical protein [Acidimicrobiaceae bacterium]MBR13273.1 hypothetical protein [Acidimicrobiaceae bacterium]|tara:strand:+ start:236 stop:529 length:294 start_codon:yes stop_codon:yes gene_type:complete
MRFIQIIESEGDATQELADVQGYAEMARGDDTVKVERVTVCSDRNRPGVVVSIAEFASWESAKQNDEHEITQEASEAAPDGTTYRDLDVHGVVEIGD